MPQQIGPKNDPIKNRQLLINATIEFLDTLPNRKLQLKSELIDLINTLMPTTVAVSETEKTTDSKFPSTGPLAILIEVLNENIIMGTIYTEKKRDLIISEIIKGLDNKGLTFPETKSPRP